MYQVLLPPTNTQAIFKKKCSNWKKFVFCLKRYWGAYPRIKHTVWCLICVSKYFLFKSGTSNIVTNNDDQNIRKHLSTPPFGKNIPLFRLVSLLSQLSTRMGFFKTRGADQSKVSRWLLFLSCQLMWNVFLAHKSKIKIDGLGQYSNMPSNFNI